MEFVSSRSFVNKYLNRLEVRSGRVWLLSRPVHVAVEPTLRCNADCLMCNHAAVLRAEDPGSLGLLAWSTLVRMRPFLRWAERVLFGGFGEPLLHPELVPMIRYIKRQGPRVYFFTNGALLGRERAEGLIEAGLDQIFVSFGGADPETYKRIRGVEMETVVENVRALSALKADRGTDRPRITFNVVSLNTLLGQLGEILRLAAELGVAEVAMPNLSVEHAHLADESPWNDLDRARRRIAEAETVAASLGLKLVPPDLNERQGSCEELFTSLTVGWDGRVLSCPLERYIIGDVNAETPVQIWNGPGMQGLRRRMRQEGIQTVCPNCFCWDNRPEPFLNPHPNFRSFAQDLRGNP